MAPPSLYISKFRELDFMLCYHTSEMLCLFKLLFCSLGIAHLSQTATSQLFLFWVPVPCTSQSNIVHCFEDSLSGLAVVDSSYSSS
jgi:hypothetical protein